MEVMVYTSPTCPYCHQAKEYLRQKGVPFTERDVSRDPGAAREIVRLTGQVGVPVITIDDHVIPGFSPQRLEQILASYRPSLGLAIADADKSAAHTQPGFPAQGAYIGRVRSGPAERAGIRTGDVVLAVDGRPIRNAADLEHLAHHARRGGHLFEIWRNGQRLEVRVDL